MSDNAQTSTVSLRERKAMVTSAVRDAARRNAQRLRSKLVRDLKVIIFFHVPKTGGTAMTRFFSGYLAWQGWTTVGLYRNPQAVADKDETSLTRWTCEQLSTLEQGVAAGRGRFYVSFHHGAAGIVSMQAYLADLKARVQDRGGRIVLCTVVREPYARMSSELKYLNALDQAHSDQAYIERFLHRHHNYMTRYLLYNHLHVQPEDYELSHDNEQLIHGLIDVFGVQDDLNAFATEVLTRVGCNSRPIKVARANVTKQDGPVIDIPQSREEFARINEWDYRLYEFAKQQQGTTAITAG